MIFIIFLNVVLSQIHFTNIPDSTGLYQPIIIENVIGLDIGDEIGLFDNSGLLSNDCSDQYGNLLVGSGLYNGNQTIISGFGALEYCDINEGFQLPGWRDNNLIDIKVWDASENVEYTTDFEFTTGSGNWGDIYSVIDLLIINEMSTISDNQSLYNIYPNPFNSYLNIYIPELDNKENTINIYDIYGRNIDNISNVNNNNLLVWNASNFKSGVYFFKFKQNNKFITQKVTLLK